MSTPRSIRMARRRNQWLSSLDPRDPDYEEPAEFDSGEFDEDPFFDEGLAAAAAEDRWIAERDRTASQ